MDAAEMTVLHNRAFWGYRIERLSEIYNLDEVTVRELLRVDPMDKQAIRKVLEQSPQRRR